MNLLGEIRQKYLFSALCVLVTALQLLPPAPVALAWEIFHLLRPWKAQYVYNYGIGMGLVPAFA